MTKLYFHPDKNFFMDWLLVNDMPTGEIILWQTLMNIGNRLGQRSTFNAPTSTLTRLTGLSKPGLMNARKKLMERGFIKFEQGSRYKAPIYQMLPIHKQIDTYFDFSKEGNFTQDFTQNLTQDLTIHKVQSSKEKRRGGRTREEELILKTYAENLNKLSPIIEEELLAWHQIFNEKIILQAIREVVKAGGKTFNYLETVLESWKDAGLMTLEEIVEYQLQEELERNKKVIPFQKPSNKNDDLYKQLLKEDF